jgi:hypothetical protein
MTVNAKVAEPDPPPPGSRVVRTLRVSRTVRLFSVAGGRGGTAILLSFAAIGCHSLGIHTNLAVIATIFWQFTDLGRTVPRKRTSPGVLVGVIRNFRAA